MSDLLRQIVAANRAGSPAAIPSVCSAHPQVLRASLGLARRKAMPVVIEATSNQVNQSGGYTGMTPSGFRAFVERLADEAEIDMAQIVLGGDHLGPQAWRNHAQEVAMAKARVMVAGYVRAGFTKIHLDCSEGCQGEPDQLSDDLAASRAAELARLCLENASDPAALVFVIGTEVPPPGGARSDEHGDISPTQPEAAKTTLNAHRSAFDAAGIGSAWGQVAGLVVQPGVEFSPMKVHHLPAGRDPKLREALAEHPHICLEAHSTDYQHPQAFHRLAELGFAFHKVGPALTFAWRQAIYALDTLRSLAGWQSGVSVPGCMEALMLAEPSFWQSHYHGSANALRLMRHFGLADRIRYYWPHADAQAAVAGLYADLSQHELPRPLLLQGFSASHIERADLLLSERGGDQVLALLAGAVELALEPYFLDRLARSTTKERM